MTSKLQTVYAAARSAARLNSAADALQWDEQTYLPDAAGPYRSGQIADLRRLAHETLTDPRYADDVRTLADAPESLDAVDADNVRLLARDLDRDARLDADLVARVATVTSRGQQVWADARGRNDYAAYTPALADVVAVKREVAGRYVDGTDRPAYDGLLDEYEPDASSDMIAETFARLRGPLVEHLRSIDPESSRRAVEPLTRDVPVEAQRGLSRAVAAAVGFDFDRGRLDETAHPFCTTLGPHDHRILTRYQSDWFPAGLYGTLHEAGHGMYEQGLPPDRFGLPAGAATSLGIHESQSRLWENHVGRSMAFCRYLLPVLRDRFGDSVAGVDVGALHRGVNAVRPSLIRVEADEVTYNLHVLIRFDLERRLIDGTLDVVNLPDAWNARYADDLGVTVPDFADGVMQDVHWSCGLIGYFPTYTLGNLAAAQLFEAAREQLPGLDDAIAGGEFAGLLGWLRDNVHRHGRRRTFEQIVVDATGRPLSDEPLIRHLRSVGDQSA